MSLSGLIHTVRFDGAVLAKQKDEWAEGRGYLSPGALSNSQLTPQPTFQKNIKLTLGA